MKDILQFIYDYYEYYFLVSAGIMGNVMVILLKKGCFDSIRTKAYAFVSYFIIDHAFSIWIKHHFISSIAGLPYPRLWAFGLKCILTGLLGALSVLSYLEIKKLIPQIFLKRWMHGHKWGIATFLYLFFNMMLNLPTNIDGWVSLWYVTDYSMGIGSRFLIGTLLRLFYIDYLDANVAYHFYVINIFFIILLVSYFADRLFRQCTVRNRPALVFIWVLFMVCPGSYKGLWQRVNMGRLENYGLLISLLSWLLYEKICDTSLKYIVITILSCISIAIYQGNIFMYYPMILMIFIWDSLCNEKGKIKARVFGLINLLVTSITFFFFQFFSYTIFGSAREMVSYLQDRTNLPIEEKPLDLELFQPLSKAFEEINIGFLTGSELPREKTFLTLVLLSPILVLFVALYLKCRCYRKTSGKKCIEVPYLYFLLFIFAITPQFLLNVDWGRWMLSLNIVMFMGFLFLVYKKDGGAVAACDSLSQWILQHRLISGVLVFYIAGLGTFNGKLFISQVDILTNWLVKNGWLRV